MNEGKCPKCERLLTNVQVEDVTVNVSVRPQWKGFNYYCPHCKSVLGTGINPLLIEDEIVSRIAGLISNK